MNTLYTLGYGAGWTPEQIRETVERLDAVLLDIRHRPWSKSPQWQQPALQTLLGPAYRHLPALGNRNYNNGGPIALADPARGVAAVRAVLDQRPAVLLCGCRDVWACHREDAAELIADHLDCAVEHLEPPPRPHRPAAPTAPPATLYHLPDWPAIRAACAAERWQAAYGAAGLCPGKDRPGLAAWQAAADYIEAEKARRLAADTAAWRERRDARAD